MGGETGGGETVRHRETPLADINAQNAMMHAGKSSEADVRGRGRLDQRHQQQFDGWVKKRWPAQK